MRAAAGRPMITTTIMISTKVKPGTRDARERGAMGGEVITRHSIPASSRPSRRKK